MSEEQKTADKGGFPHPTEGMWELVSDCLDGEKLPPTISRTINMLASGDMVAVPLVQQVSEILRRQAEAVEALAETSSDWSVDGEFFRGQAAAYAQHLRTLADKVEARGG